MERKLTAILSADVKGYSRLMGDDEIATVRTLTAYREVMTTLTFRAFLVIRSELVEQRVGHKLTPECPRRAGCGVGGGTEV